MSVQWKTSDPVGAELIEQDDVYSERSISYPPGTLVTVRYLWDAVRRHVRVWLSAALAGLAMGILLPLALPAASEASVTLLVTHRVGEDPSRAILTDISLLSSLQVAEAAGAELDLSDSPYDIQDRYTATQLTVRVVEIRTSAPTDAAATALARTLADVFLDFRAGQIAEQNASLSDHLDEAQRAVEEAEDAVRQAGGDPNASDLPVNETTKNLIEARERQEFIRHQVFDEETQQTRMNSSRVLDAAAPLPHDERRVTAISGATGLAVGSVVGLGFVLVRAMLSDRLWRRQDIAHAIGAPVALSASRPPTWSRTPGPRHFSGSLSGRPDVAPVVAHLRGTVRWNDDKPSLAVVAIDNTNLGAILVASLALELAEEGKRVLAADLTPTRALATALGASTPGTHESRFATEDLDLTVHLPDPHAHPGISDQDGDRDAELASIGADVVLALCTVSPAEGADHITRWSGHAAALITAGKSSATTIEGTGELIRLAGLQLDTVVLLRTDPTDNSTGHLSGHAATSQARP